MFHLAILSEVSQGSKVEDTQFEKSHNIMKYEWMGNTLLLIRIWKVRVLRHSVWERYGLARKPGREQQEKIKSWKEMSLYSKEQHGDNRT